MKVDETQQYSLKKNHFAYLIILNLMLLKTNLKIQELQELNQSKSQILWHEGISPRDLYKMTLGAA